MVVSCQESGLLGLVCWVLSYQLLNILNITPVHMYNLSIIFGKISVKGTSYFAIECPPIKIYMINITWQSERQMINNFMLECTVPISISTEVTRTVGFSVWQWQFVLVSLVSSITVAREAKADICMVFQPPSRLFSFSFHLDRSFCCWTHKYSIGRFPDHSFIPPTNIIELLRTSSLPLDKSLATN